MKLDRSYVTFVSVVLLTTSATTVSAQGFGVTAGVNLATVGGDDVGSATSSRVGFIGGVFYEWRLSSTWSIVPQALYSMQGVDFEEAGLDDVSWAHDYIKVPVLIRANLGSGTARPYLTAGPAIGFSVNCRMSGFFAGADELSCDELEDDFGFQKFADTDVSGILGAGVQLDAFDLNVRYETGFTNLEDEIEVRNRVWSILIGYTFTMPR